MMEPVWFPRLAAIPGISYETPSGVDVSRLRGQYPQRPRVNRYEGLPPSLWWGNTSASPAQQHALTDTRSASTGEVLTNLAEVLELPGEPSAYHFAIQSAASAAWSRRREGPEAFTVIERLCWLDLQLIQAAPSAASDGPEGDEQFFHISALDWLLDMYLREGLLTEAVQVADIAVRLGAGDLPRVTKARERAAAVAAEDVAA